MYKGYLSWRISNDLEELTRSFPFSKDERHSSHILVDHVQPMPLFDFTHLHSITLYSQVMIRYTWLGLISIFFFFLPLSPSHDNGNIVNPPICTHCIIGVCKSTSVQGPCANYTRVYKVAIHNDLKGICRTRFLISIHLRWETFITHITWSYTHPIHLCEFVHVHHVTYHNNNE